MQYTSCNFFHFFSSVAVFVGFPVLHLVVLATKYSSLHAVWIDLGQSPTVAAVLWDYQSIINHVSFCFCKCCVTFVHIVNDVVSFFQQSGEFFVIVEQFCIVLIFFYTADVGVFCGVVSVVVTVCFLNQVVLWVTVVSAPTVQSYRMQVRNVNFLIAGFDEGLDVQLYMFQDGPTEIASMESGSIDVAYIGPGAHKLCIKGQADIFCFSQLGNADCVMGLKSHGVNSLEDLKGKKVAYASGTSSETILKRALNSVGLTMDDIEAYDMEVSNMVSAIVSCAIDACAPWSPSSTTIANELGDDVQTFCTNTTFSDIAADCASWICMPSYAETNKDVLVKFTKALYKAMDFASNPDNYDEVAGYVAQECGTDKESALAQTGDGAWLDSATLLKYVGDGTIKGYYEVQQKNFIDNGDVESEVPVEDYVLFDVMEEAGK